MSLRRCRAGARLIGVVALLISTAHADVDADINAEALRANRSSLGRPLPLASHWTTGINAAASGWGPKWQLAQIALGHHLLPWIQLPPPLKMDRFFDTFDFDVYAREAVMEMCARGLPLVLVATQWEAPLAQSPEGTVLNPPVISPFSPIALWTAVGTEWATSSYLQKLQRWCPNPAMVMFLSNNEAAVLDWQRAEADRRYVALYGRGRSNEFKRKIQGDALIVRHRALQAGMRAGLTNPLWRERAKFVGYNAFGPPHLGRWWGWADYSLATPGRIDPAPLAWDGGSPSYYLMNSTPETDFTSWSPQNEFQNLVFMQREALRMNPQFWFELSVWDGYVPGGDRLKNNANSDNRRYFESLGQSYTPERYKGFVQFGMWLTRPRAVREFRDWIQPRDAATEPYFLAVVEAVDSVYRNPLLRDYWRIGRLVAVPGYRHPYQAGIPAAYSSVERWFMLSTPANGFSPAGISPVAPASTTTEIRVFSLALERGDAPRRSWLIYASSPLELRTDVSVSVPGFPRPVMLPAVTVGGNFYELSESTGTVVAVSP